MPKPSYSITLNPVNNGKITASPDAATYDSGATVTLTAVPNSGYVFKSWSGDASGTNTTVSITMTANKTITATFVDPNAKPTYTLTVTTTGSGVIKVDPDKVEFDSGSTVTLESLVANDATFNGWGGALSGNSPLVTLVMNGNKAVTASFTGNNISQDNLVKDGDFTGGATDWTFGAYENAKATGGIVGGAFQIAIQTTGTENWHIQLMQEGISLTKDEVYELTFYASATTATPIVVNIGMAVDPFTSYSQNKTFALTSTKEKYTVRFTMRQASSTAARLEFDCGKSSGTVTIDAIALVPAIELGASAPEHLLVPHESLTGIGDKERVAVSWYDHSGRLLRSIAGEYGTALNQKGYHLPGSYIVVVRIGSRQFVRRIVAVDR